MKGSEQCAMRHQWLHAFGSPYQPSPEVADAVRGLLPRVGKVPKVHVRLGLELEAPEATVGPLVPAHLVRLSRLLLQLTRDPTLLFFLGGGGRFVFLDGGNLNYSCRDLPRTTAASSHSKKREGGPSTTAQKRALSLETARALVAS